MKPSYHHINVVVWLLLLFTWWKSPAASWAHLMCKSQSSWWCNGLPVPHSASIWTRYLLTRYLLIWNLWESESDQLVKRLKLSQVSGDKIFVDLKYLRKWKWPIGLIYRHHYNDCMRKPTPLWLGSRDSGSLSHSTFGNSQISLGSLWEGLLDTGLQILPLQTWTAPGKMVDLWNA